MGDIEKRVTAKMVLDDSGYSSTLKGINSELRNNKSELKAASSGLSAYGKTSENVNRVQESLKREFELQSKKVNLYREALNKASNTLEKNAKERDELSKSLDREKEKLQSLKRAYGTNNDAYRNTEKTIGELKEKYDNLNDTLEKNAKKVNSYESNLNKAEAQMNRSSEAIGKFNNEVSKSSEKVSTSSEKLERLSEKAEGAGSKLTMGLTVPLVAAGVASVKMASDLNENLNKTEVVFKENAGVVEAWSKTALDKMGMCQSSALEMASKFGDMGSSMGLSATATMNYSMNLTQLAADMASFKNISIDRANEALTGVYTGETEALKGLGIVMTQNNLQQFAENEGIHKKIQKMNQAEQVQLRYNYIMAKTKDAQGDFARTNDQAANASRTFKEATKELGTTIGTELLPAITPLINEANNAIKAFAHMDAGTREFIVKAGIAAITLGPLVSGFGKLASGIGGVIKVGSKLGSAFGLISTGATVAEGATAAVGVAAEGAAVATTGASVAASGLGASLLAVAAPVAIGVAGVAAVGYAGYKTAKYLNSSATPAVDLFADKAVYASENIATAHGAMTAKVQTGTIKISQSTKTAVGAYLEMDKKASSSLMDLRMNSDKFTKNAKDTVIKNFTEMSKKSSSLSKEQRMAMTVNFKKLVADTGTLTKKNKAEIVKQYTDMVNKTKGLTKKQKDQTIKDFKETLTKSVALTKKQSMDLQKLYKDMAGKIKTGIDKKRADELKSQKEFFSKSNVLTTKEEANILKKTTDSWNKKKENIDKIQNQINSIIKKAADEHREITNDEAKTIDSLQKQMKENAVKTLSANEVESKVILERMRGNSQNITAEMASSKIKELNKLRDSSIKSANEECDKRIAEIIRMRDESKVISADQAEKLIADANKQKDATVKAAEDTRNEAVGKITSMNSEISSSVNTTTGEVKSNWDKLKDWWNSWWPKPKVFNMATVQQNGTGHYVDIPQRWTGDTSFKGGYTTLHERGYELYDLPQGTRIYNHESSEEMVMATARETAKGIIDSMVNGVTPTGNNDINLNLSVNLDGEKIATVSDRILGKRQNLQRRLSGGRV